jgi:hypothetical protein
MQQMKRQHQQVDSIQQGHHSIRQRYLAAEVDTPLASIPPTIPMYLTDVNIPASSLCCSLA